MLCAKLSTCHAGVGRSATRRLVRWFGCQLLTLWPLRVSVAEEAGETKTPESESVAGAKRPRAAENAGQAGETQKEHSVEKTGQSGQESEEGEEERKNDTWVLIGNALVD